MLRFLRRFRVTPQAEAPVPAQTDGTTPVSWKFVKPRYRAGFISDHSAVMLINLNRNLPVNPFCEISDQRLLMLFCDTRTPNTERILQNVSKAIVSSNSIITRLDVPKLRQLYATYLHLERSFFEGPEDGELAETDYRGYILHKNRLYPLTFEDAQPMYVYRQGHLLEYQIAPHQFVQLEPDDLFLLASKTDMPGLIAQKALKYVWRQFQAPSFNANWLKDKKGKKLLGLVSTYILGIRVMRDPGLNAAPVSALRLNRLKNWRREHWLMFALVTAWLAALIYSTFY